MKRKVLFIVLMAVLSANTILAQNTETENIQSKKIPFSIKAYPFRGMYLDKNTHYEKFGPIFPAGVHMGLEFPSLQQRPWQQYLGNPTVGLGLSWLDFGNPQDPGMAKLGMGVAVYPYILIDAIDTDYFQMRFKVAGGLAAVTEHWYTQEDTDPDHYYEPTVNTIFGCTLNVYLNAGINLNVPVTKYLAFGTEFGYFHMSNGRTCMPNIGMNSIYGSVGLTATINHKETRAPKTFPDLPYGWAINLTGAAGAQKSAIKDPNRFFISSIHAGAVYHVTNWYGIGAGLDLFYNGAIDKNTDRYLYRKDRDYTFTRYAPVWP
ncbi:MAG: acyloxyacyl hydrolase [Bacteroidales bacterium]|nr:acyloxyacyl hydrolase [Bacteroidales bacterium]